MLGVLVVGYLAAIGWLMLNETRLIFDAGRDLGPARPAAPFALVELPRNDGARQIAFSLSARAHAGDAPWLLFLHGNASTIGSRFNVAHCEQLRALGVNVLAPEYRGFAGLPGTPSEAAVTDDARAAFDYLRTGLHVPPGRIVVYGWSLGSAVAVNLAAEVDEAAVILEGAPSSIASVGAQRYPMFPIRMIIRNPFDSILRIGRIGSPVLFLHSPEDDIVPIAEGRRLFDAARPPRTFVEVAGGHVYASQHDAARFSSAIREFLVSQHLLR